MGVPGAIIRLHLRHLKIPRNLCTCDLLRVRHESLPFLEQPSPLPVLSFLQRLYLLLQSLVLLLHLPILLSHFLVLLQYLMILPAERLYVSHELP